MLDTTTTYNCKDCDIFAAGVVLFMMLLKRAPFERATKADGLYNLIINCDWETYWNHIEEDEPNKTSKDFKELVQKLLEAEPGLRMQSMK